MGQHMLKNFIAYLLHAANSDPIKHFWFYYGIKDRVLKRFGQLLMIATTNLTTEI